MAALSYRQVLERYDRAKAFGETKSLQEYSTHLNDIYGTQDFSEGLRDGPWTRFSTRADQVLGDSVGQVTGPLGEAVGGMFDQPEAGRKVGEGLPRALLQTLPLYLAGPEVGIPATVAALGGTGLLFGGQTYADTGSSKAALLSGATAAALPPVGRFAGELGAAAFGAPRIAGELATGGYMNSVVPTTVGQRAAAFGASQLAQGALQEASGYAQQKTTNPDEPYNFLSPEFLIGQIPFTIHDAVGTFGKPLMTREQAQGLVKQPVPVSKGTERFVPPESSVEEQATTQAAMHAYSQVAQDQSIDPVERSKKLAALLATVNQPKVAQDIKQVEKAVQPSPLDTEVTLSGKAEKMSNGSYRVRVDDLNSSIPVRLPEHRTVFVNGAAPVVDPVTGKATFKVKVSQVDPRAKYGIAEEQQLDPNQNPELPVQEQGPLTQSEKAALDSVGVEHTTQDEVVQTVLKPLAEQVERAQVQHEDATAKSAVVPTKAEEWQEISKAPEITKPQIEEQVKQGATSTQAAEHVRLTTQTPEVDAALTKLALMAEEGQKIKQAAELARVGAEDASGNEQHKYGLALKDEVGGRREFRKFDDAQKFIDNLDDPDKGNLRVRASGRDSYYIAPIENLKTSFETPRTEEGSALENVLSQDTFREPGSNEMAVSRLPRVAVNAMLDSMELLEGASISLERKLRENGLTREQWDSVQNDWQQDTYDSTNPDHMLVANMLLKMKRKLSNTSLGSTIPYDKALVEEIGVNRGAKNVVDWIGKQNIPVVSQLIDGYKNFPDELAKLSFVHEGPGWVPGAFHYLEDLGGGTVNMGQLPTRETAVPFARVMAHEITHHMTRELASRNDQAAQEFRVQNQKILATLRKSEELPKKVRDYLAKAQKEDHYDQYRTGKIPDITEHWRKALGNELTEQYSDVLYGLLNQDEMLSQMFSAHKFIAFLDSTRVPKSEGKGALNWFGKIWSKLVGRPTEETASAFEELLRGYDNYLSGGVLRKVYGGMDFIRDSLIKEVGARPEALASRMQTAERTFAKGDLYNSIYGFQRESEAGTLPATMTSGQLDQPLRTALVSGEIRDVFRGTMSLLPEQLPTHQDLWYRMSQDVKLARDLVAQVKSGALPGVDLPARTESNLKLAQAKLNSMQRALDKQALALERQGDLSNFQTPFADELLVKQLLSPALPNPESPAPETATAQALMGLRKLSPQRTLAQVKEATSGEELAGKGLGWLEKQLALTSFFKKVHPESRPVLNAVQDMHGQAMEWSRELGLVLNSSGDASKGEVLKVDPVLRKQLERVATTKPLTEAFSDAVRTIAEKTKMGEAWDWSQPEFKQILRPLNQTDRAAVQAMQRQFMLRHEHFVNNIVPKAFGELNQENTGQIVAALQGGILPEQARELSGKLHQALQNLNDPSTSMVGQALLSEVQSQLSPQTFLAALRHANQSVMDVNQFLKVARQNLDFVSEQRFDKEHMRMTGPDGQRFYTSAGSKAELQKRRQELEARGYKFNYYTAKSDAQSPSGGVNPEIMQKLREMDTLAVTRLSEALSGRQDSAELMARILPEVQRAAEYTTSAQSFAPVPHISRNLVEGREYLNMIHNADEFYGRGVNWLNNKILTSKTGLDMMHPEVAGNQVLKDYLTQHVKNYQTPDNPLVRKFTEAMFYQRMAFNLGNTMLEGVQSLGTGMQALIAETGSVRDAFKLTSEAAKEWAYQKAKGKGSSEDMEWLRRKGEATGATEPALWDDIYDPERADMMSISAKLGAPVKKGTDVLKSAARSFSTFFQKYNNNIALVAAYKIARERGMGQEDAFRFARDVKERGTFTGGKPQRSVGLWGIKSRPVPQLMSSLQTYVLGWFNQMANDYRIGFKGAGKDITPQQRAGSKKAFVYGLAAQAVLAGGLGLPGVGQGIALLNQATGLDLKGWLRQNLSKLFDEDEDSGGLLTNLALRGVANSVTPIDPSNRAAIAVPFVGVDPYKGFSIAALAGAPGSSVSDFVQGLMAAARGDAQGFQKLLPSVLRGPAQLLQGDLDVRDSRGGLLQTLSPAERWMQGLGLPSSRIQRSRDTAEALKKQEDSLQRTKEAQVDGLAKLVRQGNLTEVQRQMLLAKREDPGLDLKALSRSIANRVVAQTVPYESRHNVNPGVDIAGMNNRAPSSEALRRNIAYGVQQSLGFQPTYNPRADAEAAALDDALNNDPFLRRDQALRSLRGTRPTRNQSSPAWTQAFQ